MHSAMAAKRNALGLSALIGHNYIYWLHHTAEWHLTKQQTADVGRWATRHDMTQLQMHWYCKGNGGTFLD